MKTKKLDLSDLETFTFKKRAVQIVRSWTEAKAKRFVGRMDKQPPQD